MLLVPKCSLIALLLSVRTAAFNHYRYRSNTGSHGPVSLVLEEALFYQTSSSQLEVFSTRQFLLPGDCWHYPEMFLLVPVWWGRCATSHPPDWPEMPLSTSYHAQDGLHNR